ncbi:MAG TPA: hypothetical protein VHF87_09800 [Methylomirabilota bacterium]|nr:hypothetical protein [Methylomirabilota bacterium]
MADRGSCRRGVLLFLCVTLLLAACGKTEPRPGEVLDEASRAGRPVASFPAATEDYFHDMDGGGSLTPEEVQGRNTWIVWTGGNDRFWDAISVSSFGVFDLLKIVSSHPDPTLKHFGRHNRWSYLGLINEPCFEKPTGPDPRRYGLWLDNRRADCPPDPFENEQKYPGVRIGARGRSIPVGSYYGHASGIVGLRLFPNPDFDEAAAKKWDPVKYYTDEKYYNSKDLVRPYRVGMSCGFCHVGPSPTKPPSDAENPRWENLASNVGAQYFWVQRIFSWKYDRTNYMYQLLNTSRPGALDTSLVSTDYINNPRTMNAVYQLGPRLELAKRWGKETLTGGALHNRQLNDYVTTGPLTEFFQKPDTVWTPRVLKDGSDSVGALGALNRVYLNIGLFSEEWLLHFKALVGGKPITPIEISVARKNSNYWLATEAQSPAMALFFLRAATPHRLRDAPGGAAFLTKDQAALRRGKLAFADRCARCHSSKGPEPAPGMDPGGCAGPGYLTCWNRYWDWTKTDEYKQKMRQIVLADDFLEGNFLSNEIRVPVTLLETNACSPLATNAIGGNIWDNFSSQSYKDLPSVGTITVHDPFTGAPRPYQMPAGGRGYTRPSSLVSVWSTAPFLQNNSLGRFDPSPSVEARLGSFQDSIEKLLWPERRDKDAVLGDKVPGTIDRTTAQSFLRVPAGYLPDELAPLLGRLNRHAPWLFGEGGVQIGPIPAGTPVNLLANLELMPDGADLAQRAAHLKRMLPLLHELIRDLKKLDGKGSDEEARRAFAPLVPRLLALSKCPDFVVDRGHYFGTSVFTEEPGLSDEDKRALIEFLKTF